ncbi:MAG: class I SAM-dependent methyltransferase [Clostridiales bacterium]|nr:class I SAM-dependent methyltransferase [Clostridiales bacterium]
MYTAFASVYDRLMADVDYSTWAAFYRKLLCRYGVEAGAVCECACGTGGLTLPLAKTYDMTGADLSADMLAVASAKARHMGLSIPFVQMDMRKLALHRLQDAVLCTCDGVNYLPCEQDVSAFFHAAHRALKPGGALALDVSTPWKLENILGNHTHGEDAEDISYLWKNRFDAKPCRVDMRLVIFKREADGRYGRIVEEQTQYGYTIKQLKALLEAAGFADIRAYGDKTLNAPTANETRWHIAARKER